MRLRHRRKDPPREISEATVARIQAERDLATTKAETEWYRVFGETLRTRRERNHLRIALEQTFQRRGHA